MTEPNIFTVTPEHLSRFTPDEAVDFISQLLWAESMRSGLPTSDVHVTTRISTKDGGIDATVDPRDGVNFTDSFLWPGGRFGLQIKAGSSFSPTETQLRKELFGDADPAREALGDSVRQCMDADGTYILVCAGTDPTPDRIEQAVKHLEASFVECGYQEPDVKVWGQSTLIGFLKRFPSIALWVNGNGNAQFQTHASWAGQIEMRRPFKTGDRQQKFIDDARAQLRRHDGAVHLRVRGEAGIGKTRLVLEVLRADDLSPLVVYCDGPQKFLNGPLLNELLRDDNEFHVVAVVDECDRKSYTAIWNQLGGRGNRIKLISVHNDIDEPSGGTVVLDAPPLDDVEVSAVIQEYDVPKDHADRWAYYCDGSPRVAHVIGQNLKSHPDDILKQPDSVDLWDRYIAGDDDPASQAVQQRRTVLRFLALFKRFGYEGPVVSEAQSIWKLINEADPAITWPRFQEIIKLLRDRRLLQGETTLYITPKFLHIELWTEWFEIYGAGFNVDEFEARLTPDLIEWFREMFRYARESRDAMKVVNKLLDESGPFGSADFFRNRGGAEFFLRLTDAAPDAALRRLERTVGTWSVDQLRDFGEGRRQVVWALERIAVWKELFAGAARLLLRLAAAENENFANNATGVFADLFSPGHGPVAPTEASPEERFPALVEAITSPSSEERQAGRLAADHALTTGHFFRMVGAEHQGLRRPPQLWTPKTWGEIFDAYRRVWRLLEERLDGMPRDEQKEAVKILLTHARGVGGMANLTPMVVGTLTELLNKRYVDRRDLIEVVEDIYRYDASSFEPEVRPYWDKLRAVLTPNDFHSRLERYVGMNRWADLVDEEGQRRSDKIERLIRDLAAQAFADHQLLMRELSWLVTDEAKNGFQFGYELGQLDSSVELLDALLDTQRKPSEKPSAFFLGGYLRALFERSPNDCEELLDKLAKDDELKQIVPELSWRSGLTDRGALRILALARSRSLDTGLLRMFTFGGVVKNLSESVFLQWLEFLLELNTSISVGTAVDLCHFYYLVGGTPRPLPRAAILRVLTANPFFEPSGPGAPNVSMEYDWSEVAEAFVEQHPDASLELASKMLAHFGERQTIVGGFRPQSWKVLEKILRHHPEELWKDIERYLSPPIDSRAFQIRHWLRDGALTLIPPEPVWKWVDEDPEKRARYLAKLVPPVFPGDDKKVSAREVLVRYGSRKDVRNNLMANFSSEIWWGPESSHHQAKLEQLRSWKSAETNANVVQWLDEYATSVERRIERARIDEERED